MLNQLEELYHELTGRNDVKLTMNMDIEKDLGMTSLLKIRYISLLEDTYDFEFPNSVLKKIKKVKDIADYIEKNR